MTTEFSKDLGTRVATDMINQIDYPKHKLAFGADGTATDVSATNPLPVSASLSIPNPLPVSGTFWQATQPVSIATMPTTPVTGTFFQAVQPVSQAGWASVNAPVRYDYATPVTTSAWTELVSAMSQAAEEISIFDSSGQTLVLGFGALGSEVAKINIFPGGNGVVKLHVPSGTRVSVKALSADATSGELDINFLG